MDQLINISRLGYITTKICMYSHRLFWFLDTKHLNIEPDILILSKLNTINIPSIKILYDPQ